MAKKNITTIEGLAELINGTMASKEDIKALEGQVNTRFDSVESRLDTLDARLGRIEAAVHALRDEMVHRREFEDVLDRVKYLEKKLGIESGV
jgi:chromosome segregation ATPase